MSQLTELHSSKKKISLSYFLNRGHARTIKAKKNILASVLVKCISVVTSFVLVPLTIHYLNPVNYGIWLTLYSVISWFGLLDIGLGNGLRNKFAEALANNDTKSARIYLSTAYAMLSIIMGSACILFLLANQFLDWPTILNVDASKVFELRKVMAILFGFFCLQLVVKLISSVLLADQRTAIAGSINTVASVISLVVVYILTKTTSESLLYLAFSIGLINVIVPVVVSIWFFRTHYKNYAPSLKHVNFKYAKSLMNIGFMFFLFQSTALIVVATDNVIISQLMGAESVTPYNIALKYLSPITIGFTLISAPLWSAYTEAFTLNDMSWIKRITNKMVKIWLLVFLLTIPVVLLSGFAYKLWVGREVVVPSLQLTIWMAVYVLISSWNQIFGNFINGVSKMRLAFYLTIVTAIINIPLCIFFAGYLKWGLSGIIIASSVSLIPDLIFLPIQYYKITNNKATGIWNK
ncbi:MAG: MATE family efflux transporter [Bacteroidetes bacterium]|nr:MATE family efflux transporter [Bacteroidota bacterium]